MALIRCSGAGLDIIPVNSYVMTGFTPGGSGFVSDTGTYTDDTAFAVNKATYSSSSSCFINTKGKTSLIGVGSSPSWGGVGIKADGTVVDISAISTSDATDITDFDYVIISVASGSVMGSAYTIKIS